MLRKAILTVALLGAAELTHAAYDQFYFPGTGNGRCQDAGNACPPPSVCAHDSVTDAHYCCSTGQKDAVCWINSKDCRGEDKKPATGQLGCPTNASPNGYCCRSEREKCTQRDGQINICWATPENLIANVDPDYVNSTYSSLLSASPSAKTLTVDVKSLLTTSSSSAPATSTPAPSSSNAASSSGGSASAESSPTSSPSATNNPPASSTPESSSGVAGGTIGGIVVGAVAGIALVGGGIFMLLRRKNAKSSNEKLASASPSSPPGPSRPAEMDGASNPYANSTHPYANSAHAYSAVAQGPPGSGAGSPSAKYAYVNEAGAGHGNAWNHPVEMSAEAPQELDAGVEKQGPRGVGGVSPR